MKFSCGLNIISVLVCLDCLGNSLVRITTHNENGCKWEITPCQHGLNRQACVRFELGFHTHTNAVWSQHEYLGLNYCAHLKFTWYPIITALSTRLPWGCGRVRIFPKRRSFVDLKHRRSRWKKKKTSRFLSKTIKRGKQKENWRTYMRTVKNNAIFLTQVWGILQREREISGAIF